MDTEETTQSTEMETQPDAGVEVSDSDSDSNETAEGAESGEGQTPVSPEYTPDYKLKVYDEEKELTDPFLKALIKDAESEKKVKEIAQKFLGFDTAKSKAEKSRADFESFKTTTQPKIDTYDQYQKLAQKGDLESIFQFLKIPDNAIFQWAVQKAQLQNLPADQRQQYEMQRQVMREREQYQEQNQNLQSQVRDQEAQMLGQQINWILSRPDVHTMASQYDSRVNQPGAFRSEVINRGLAHHARTGQTLPAETAIQEVMRYLGPIMQPVMAAGQQPTLTPQSQAPVMPNIQGRSTSPVKTQVRSIADLQKRRRELQSQ